MVVACAGGLLGFGSTGCAPSRDAAYERILRGEIESVAAAPERFTAAFPENRTLELASADAGN